MRLTTAALLILLTAGSLFGQTLEDGVSNYRQHRFLLAEQSLEAVVKQEPRNLQAREYLALTFAARKLFDEAQAELAEAEKLGAAADRVALIQAHIAAGKRDRRAAVESLDRAIAANPKSADAYQLRALLQIQAKRFDGAASDLDHALELRRNDPYDHFYAALVANGKGDRRKTVTELERFVELAPISPDIDRVEAVLRVMN